jgi:hypothetical protein
MGYILLLVVGAAVLIGLAFLFMGGRRRPAGRTMGGGDVTRKTPAADDVTPAASDTASQSEASAAQKKIPPA